MRALPGILAVVVGVTSGCSVIFVRGPAARRLPGGEVKCTDSPAVPIGDAFLATIPAVPAGVLLAAAARGQRCGSSSQGEGSGSACAYAAMGAGILTLAAALVASSIYGFVQVGRCNAARDAARASAQRQAWLPPPVAGPGPP